MTPEQRRTAVPHARGIAGLSERRACRLVGLGRATQRYQPLGDSRLALRTRPVQLAEAWPRRGYKFLGVRLWREGVLVNRKLVLRLYREPGLSVRKRRRKRVAAPRTAMRRAERPNERWCMDFISDAVASGRTFRCLTLVDELTRECPVIAVDTSLPGNTDLSSLMGMRTKASAGAALIVKRHRENCRRVENEAEPRPRGVHYPTRLD